jgi:TonB-linked SusC/RagA family outer membrane protein
MDDDLRRASFGRENTATRNGISIMRYENRNITWEKARKTNIGMELGLWNKIEIQADYFTEHRTNILMNRTDIPTTMGLSSVVRANVGEATGKGLDLSIDYTERIGKDFWATVRGNFTYATSKVKVYEEPQYDERYLSHVGYSTNQTWGYIAERLFVDDGEVLHSPRQNFGVYAAGDIKYRDVNGDGEITTRDRVPIGYPTVPEIVYGFGFSSGYKHFDLSVFFQGLARESFWIDPYATAPFVSYRYSGETINSVLQNQLLKAYADDHWSEENRNLYAIWPRLSNTYNANNAQTSTWFMQDGAFLRLKSAELGYTLPDKLLRRYKVDNLRFYVSGTNLLTWSKFKLWDVEMGGNGLGYPVQKVYNAGIQISF